jgi:hypothetical protein
MASGGLADLFAFAVMAAFIGLMIYGIYKLVLIQEKRLAESFKKIGSKYGLKFEKDLLGEYGRKKGPVIKGSIKGHDFVCYTYQTGGGKHTVYWTEFKLRHNLAVEGYSLRLVNENIFRKMGKGLGMVNEIEIGVQDFDKRFLIDSENLSTTRSLFNRAVREKITSVPNMYFGELLIGNQDFCYKLPLVLSQEKTRDHFQTTLDATLLILDELKRVYR